MPLEKVIGLQRVQEYRALERMQESGGNPPKTRFHAAHGVPARDLQ